MYMDNYYSSPTLYSDLVLKGMDAVGIYVSTRTNFPNKQMNQVKLKRGESVFLTYNDLTAVRFFEKQNVFMLSTCHSKDLVKIRRRGASEDLDLPLMIHHYNCEMGESILPINISYTTLGRKSMKLYRHVCWRLIEMAVFNSFVIYKAQHTVGGSSRIQQLNYRLELSNLLDKPLIDKRNAIIHPVTSRSPTVPERLLSKHFLYRSQTRLAIGCVEAREREDILRGGEILKHVFIVTSVMCIYVLGTVL